MIHFLLVTLDGKDLLELAIASIDNYAGDCELDIVDLPAETIDPWAHGRAIDFWRRRQKIGIRDTDLVAIMDPDCAILSDWWRREVDEAFSDPTIGIWGAGSTEDFGPRVHASMMVVRGELFNNYEYSFMPQSTDARWRDTGGNYCRLASQVYTIMPIERGHHYDWHGASAWYPYHMRNHMRFHWDHETLCPMWVHLGGGSFSDPARMTRWQRITQWQAIRRRERFKRAVRSHLQG